MMDSIDRKLIQLLSKDGRQSSQQLSKQLNVSAATVRRRINNLIKSGIIRITAVVDVEKYGIAQAAVFALKVEQNKLESVMQSLAKLPEIKWVSTTTGRQDILAGARFSSTDELYKFMRQNFPRIEGIKETETSICLHLERKDTLI